MVTRPFRVGERAYLRGANVEVEIAYVNPSGEIVSIRTPSGHVEDFVHAHWLERLQPFAGKFRKWGKR